MRKITQAADGTVRLYDDGTTVDVSRLDYVDMKILKAYADNSMRAKLAAKQLDVHFNLVYRRLDRIWDKTGLDPHNFYNLGALLELIKREG